MESLRASRLISAFGCLASLLLCINTGVLCAQTTSATLSGIVTDPTDKVVPGAEVTATSTDTGVASRTKTNGNGIYLLPTLQYGHYSINVSKQGFRQIELKGVTLDVAAIVTRNFHLELGAASDTITVEGSGLNVNTDNASVSTVISREFIDEIPLNGRTLQNLLPLVPGVILDGNGGATSIGAYSVNGNRDSSSINWTLDGISANIQTAAAGTNPDSLQPGLSILGTTQSLVSLDALQEFRVSTSSYGVEYGVSPGAQIQLETRSGTNQFHGSAYEYLRNEDLDAHDWFVNAKSLARPPERQNDFGGTFGGPVRISHVYNGRDKAFFFFSFEELRLLQPSVLTDNPVPTAAYRQSAPAAVQPFLNALPLPNGPMIGNTGWGTYNVSLGNPSLIRPWGIRGDYALGKMNKIFGRVNYAPSNSQGEAIAYYSKNQQNTVTVTAGIITTPAPSISNDLRYNFSQMRSSSTIGPLPATGGSDPTGAIAALAVPTQYITPGSAYTNIIQITDPSFPGTVFVETSQSYSLLHQFNLVDGLKWQVGRHQFKFGGEWNRHGQTQLPVSYQLSVSFNSLAALQSLKTSGGSTLVRPTAVDTTLTRSGLYAGDTWKMNQRLSVDYGVRWELPFPAYFGGPYQPYFVSSLADPTTPTISQARTQWAMTWRNFAPRLGIAYVLRDKGNFGTVLRAGGGLFYSTETANFGALGFPNSLQTQLGSQSYPISQSIVVPPALPAVTAASIKTRAFSGFDPNLKLPRVWQWNVAVEQKLGKNQSFTANYVGSAGRRLLVFLQGIPASGNISSYTFTENAARSDYNALQLKYERHFGGGLQVLTSWTWAHSLDNASVDTNTAVGEWGNSDFDVRHVISTAIVYNVPGVTSDRVTKAVTSGWVFSTNFQAHSALPVYKLAGNSIQLPDGTFLSLFPNLLPGVPIYLYGAYPGGKKLNRAAFVQPPAGVQGNASRNEFRALGMWQLDTSIQRKFVLSEKLGLFRVRVDAFNLLNHPNFGQLNTSNLNTSATFGQATNMLSLAGTSNTLYNSGGSRSLQVSLRYEF